MFADFDARTSMTLLGNLRVYNDREAWSRFMTLYLPMMQVWARRFGLSDDDTEELTGRLLAKLVEVLPKFEYDPAKGSFRGWLKTVAQRELTRVHLAILRRFPLSFGGISEVFGSLQPAAQ